MSIHMQDRKGSIVEGEECKAVITWRWALMMMMRRVVSTAARSREGLSSELNDCHLTSMTDSRIPEGEISKGKQVEVSISKES